MYESIDYQSLVKHGNHTLAKSGQSPLNSSFNPLSHSPNDSISQPDPTSGQASLWRNPVAQGPLQPRRSLRFLLSMALTLLIIGTLAACGADDKSANSPPANQNTPPAGQMGTDPDPKDIVKMMEYKGGPAELLILDVNSGTTDEQFQKYFKEPLQAKYPQITLVQTREALNNLITAGTPPDMVLVSNPGLITILEADLPENLTNMIKEYNIDLAKFDRVVIEQIHKLGNNEAFYGIPFAMNYGAMVHNRNIFDKFGYDYPKEVMTYEELLELGRKLTRPDSGVNYIGVMPPDLRQMYWQGGIPIFDAATGKAKLTTERHAQAFNLIKEFYTVPGYLEGATYRHSVDLFFKEQRMAMYPNWIAAMNTFFTNAGTKDDFSWDLTAHPTYSNSPTSGKEVDFHMIVVNKASKNKEAAYQVVLSMITEEVQTIISRAGRVTVLNNPDIQKVYGEDNDIFTGKNLSAIFKVTPSPLPDASKYDAKINGLLNGEVSKSVAVDGLDINTALRNAERSEEAHV